MYMSQSSLPFAIEKNRENTIAVETTNFSLNQLIF